MTETESDDFWTATEDEHSIMEKVGIEILLLSDSYLSVIATPTSAFDGTERGSKGNQGLQFSRSLSPCSLSSSPLLLLHRAPHPSYQQLLPLQ